MTFSTAHEISYGDDCLACHDGIEIDQYQLCSRSQAKFPTYRFTPGTGLYKMPSRRPNNHGPAEYT